MAYGARALGSRSANSSRGSDAPPGRTGEPFTGRSGTGNLMGRDHEVREMRTAETVLNIIRDKPALSKQVTGELDETEIAHVQF